MAVGTSTAKPPNLIHCQIFRLYSIIIYYNGYSSGIDITTQHELKLTDLVHDLRSHPAWGTNKGEPLSLLPSRGWQVGSIIQPTADTKVYREGGRGRERRWEVDAVTWMHARQ